MKKIILAVATALALVSCTSVADQDIEGRWEIESALGLSTDDSDEVVYIEFSNDGKVNGNAGVNTFFGDYKLKGEELTLGDLAMTKMMGFNMAVEDSVTKALNSVAYITVDDDRAFILNANRDTIMTLVNDFR